MIYEPGLPVPVSARWNPSRKVFPNGCEQEEAMPLQDAPLAAPSG